MQSDFSYEMLQCAWVHLPGTPSMHACEYNGTYCGTEVGN